MLALAVSSAQSSAVFAGTALPLGGGPSLFRSLNGGIRWTPLAGGIPTASITTIVIPPAQDNVLYVGTSGSGVYKSVDRGDTWQTANTGLPPNAVVNDLAADPSDPTTIYASAHDPSTFEGDVFVSTDGGGQWTPTGLGSDPKALSVDPTQPDVLYAGASRSNDGGQTWLPMTFDDHCDCGTPTGFAIDPTNHLTVYASLDQGLIYKGSVQRSTDGGDSWTEVLSTDPVKSLVIDPSDPATVYAGTGQYAPGKVLKSTDEGSHWSTSTTGLPTSEIQALAVDPADPSLIFAGSSADGVAASADAGTSWELRNAGLVETNVQALGISPAQPHSLYAGIGGGGVSRSRAGPKWVPTARGLAFRPLQFTGLVVDPTHRSTAYMALVALCDGCDQSAVEKTTDSGASWTDVSPDTSNHAGGLEDLVIDPVHPDTLYAADFFGAVDKTSDGGAHWTQSFPGSQYGPPLRLAVSLADPNIVYLGTCWICVSPSSAAGVLKSTDGGQTWSAANVGIAQDDVRDLALDPFDPDVLYAAVHDNGDGTDGVVVSNDGGGSWADASSGLPGNVRVNALALDPANPDRLYAGTSGAGVFVTTNGGSTWTPMNAGLSDTYVNALAINPDSSTLFAGTQGGGVFATPLP